ncbi:hypothetical protein LQF76_10450 [Gloeomargaritales cyanobacterium VI4D9]|nr:hypothetical protein LQF76_10450 [Gloeomargaritales cyanobacterium VI4D9]
MGLMLLPVLLGLILAVPALGPELVQSPNGEALLLVPEQLALTPEQQTRLEEIQTQAATRVHQILTPAQQEQWTSLWHNTQPLDLTQEQKKQMTALRMQVLGQMHQVLTPAQRQQWQAQR